MDHDCLGLWIFSGACLNTSVVGSAVEKGPVPRFLEELARQCPPQDDFLGGLLPEPCSRLLCPFHAGEMPSAPHCLRFLFTERLYIKCFSFRIGSFNMFYRKPFYVQIKNARL